MVFLGLDRAATGSSHDKFGQLAPEQTRGDIKNVLPKSFGDGKTQLPQP